MTERFSFKPFGGHEYSYPSEEGISIPLGFATWALQTAGTFGVDWREALVVLGVSVGAQEWGAITTEGMEGSSFVWNAQLGYCLFRASQLNLHPFVKFTIVAGLAADLYGAQRSDVNINNKAHLQGLALGAATALLVNLKKKRGLY